ncbi:23S rRNA (uracil(1939)-C(5))-methyltransferase RlmD [Shewanella maritima]|uniref:23S rRNA (uracil(1939)-C(5))-methyltransferase RlmD n=1 Tax=Shewanella maritima TaxID=2520507 RepID=UPI003736BB05
MANFYKPKANKSKQLSAKTPLSITQLDHMGAGIGEYLGKVVFVPGALAGEQVTVQLTEQKKRFAKAKLHSIDHASDARVKPICQYYEQCGGCDLQHLQVNEQRQHKQAALISLIEKLSTLKTIEPKLIAPALVGEATAYRRRARLATLVNKKNQRLQLGFRAANSHSIVPVNTCPILMPELAALIEPFSMMLNQLKGKASLGHLELTHADNGIFAVLRITKSLANSDIKWLFSFAQKQQIILILQTENALRQVYPELSSLELVTLPYYGLNNGSLSCEFTPGNFVQVNGQINQAMVAQAVDWLNPQADERILDLFCGVGNFSLALASSGAQVIGVEGVESMVVQAKHNAEQNQLDNLTFYHADLSADLSEQPWLGQIDKMLLDPARAGAYESLHWLEKLQPKQVVYVSCNPASLARDCNVLFEQGYQLTKINMIDMFPQTHHIEAMAMFELMP